MLLTLPCVAAFLHHPRSHHARAVRARRVSRVGGADHSAMALVAYGVGLPAFVLVRCVTPSFYARHDTATPVRATMISVAANIALKIAAGVGAGLRRRRYRARHRRWRAWINLGLLVVDGAPEEACWWRRPNSSARSSPSPAAVAAAAAGFFAGARLGDALACCALSRRDHLRHRGADRRARPIRPWSLRSARNLPLGAAAR